MTDRPMEAERFDVEEIGRSGTMMGLSPETCPSCGNTMTDMRGKAFAISQSAAAGLCVYIGDGDYACATEERRRWRNRFNRILRTPREI